MQNLPYLIYLFFNKRKFIFTILIIGICGLLGFYASQITLEEDITRFIPNDKNTTSINSILQNLKSKDKLVIHFSSFKPEDIDLLIEKADVFYDSLQAIVPKESYNSITYKLSENTFQNIYEIFYENIPLFLDAKDYSRINNLLVEDSIKFTLKRNYSILLSPSGIVLSKYIQKDPLNIIPIALRKLNDIQLDENFETYNGAIVTKDHKHLLMFVTPSYGANETEKNKRLIYPIKSLSKNLSTKELKIEIFGASIVSLGNAEQLRKDTLLTTSITVILIALLIGFYFKNLSPILFIFLPVAFGMTFSLAMMFLFKGVVSAIAIASGAAVLGIAINYSLHFFTHYKHVRNLKEVINDLTVPMLIGCTTTVGAFFSLIFTKSEALHDFGQFAGFSLIGAMLFSIFVLPHLLKISFGKESNEVNINIHKNTWLDKLVALRPDRSKWIALTAIVITLVFGYFAPGVEFESDMNKMSFMDDETRMAESHLDEVNNFAARSVYLFSRGKTMDEALYLNERVNLTLDSLKQLGVIKKISSIVSVYPSLVKQAKKINEWNDFLNKNNPDSIRDKLIRIGKLYKFKEDAFNQFYNLLNNKYSYLSKPDLDSLKKKVVNEYISVIEGLPSVMTHVKVEAENKELIYALFKNETNVTIFDRQHLTSQFVEIISSDFSTILWITSLLVFGFMLVSHGRIELAVINFLPMFISWLWILGIMSLVGIKFNVINIIISTFIFGLGDDYSIFIMDSLTTEYKYGKQKLSSFKTSILLSALTTIIGIGVLIFAKHPALQSIALITIIGMICVVLVSFIIQPFLFNWMILNRKYKGYQPYTFKYLCITAFGFIMFSLFSVILTVIGLLIITIYPAGKRKRKLAFHYVIAYTFRAVLKVFINVKKRKINMNGEDFKKPAIIIANHQSHIDLALTLQLHPKMIVFTNDWVYNSPFYGWIVRMADYYPSSSGYENSLEKLEVLVKEGYSILIFPEGTRSIDGKIQRFHKGAFLLAEKLNLDILPILIHGAGDTVTKNDFHFKDGALTLKILARITLSDLQFGSTYQERTKLICNYMRNEYSQLRLECETVDYFRSRLIHNYIYKGPVLEWYCRIKTALEDNYRLFEGLMPKQGKIVDVGCGYGFLPYTLMLTGENRNIIGLDYDEEKIDMASNCGLKNERIEFKAVDITTFQFPIADGYIISDVLHYLEPNDQVRVLNQLAANLNKNGVLVIRDADADLKSRQKGTWYTEFISTNVGFNKTKESGLHFVSGQHIMNVFKNYPHLDIEIIDNTKLTSNIIYVVRYL